MKHPVAATSMSIQNYLKVSVFFFFLSEKAVSGEGVPSTGQVGESRKTLGMSRGPRGRWPGGWAGGSQLSFLLSSTSISYRSSGFEKANEIR